MYICLHKVIVENEEPYSLNELLFAMPDDFSACRLIENALIDILERIAKLCRVS